jgi:prepilin peptidase CpaA
VRHRPHPAALRRTAASFPFLEIRAAETDRMTATPALYAVVAAFAGLVAWAAVSDVRTMTIPNRIALAIAALWPVWLLVDGAAWGEAAAAAGVAMAVLAVGFVLFARNWFGGGDAKLTAAVALWAGTSLIIEFLLVMAVAGGAVALTALAWRAINRKLVAVPYAPASTEAAKATADLPYGVPIAAGGLWVALRLVGI